MAEQRPSTYFATNYKFNGKELDEETGLYYYGARYYDPRISIWYSVDPLAEKYPNASPYNYCMQNPINLIDPTGMSAEGPGKNIYIVLDYDGKKPMDADRDTVSFKDMEKNGWIGIYAQNLQDANKLVKDCLKGETANNILLETHGAHTISSKGEVNGTLMYSDNNTDSTINDRDLGKSVNGVNNRNQSDVDALIGIVNNIKPGGTFALSACTTGQSDSFFNNLGTLTGNNVNMIGSADWCGAKVNLDKSNPTNKIYTPSSLFNKDYIKPEWFARGAKYFQAGCSGEKSIQLKNYQINNKGINPIY